VILPAILSIGFLLLAISNYARGEEISEPLGEFFLAALLLSFGIVVCFSRSLGNFSSHI
jgi:hypothetical protein